MATGKYAIAICDRCGVKVPYKKLRPDGYNKSLYVCEECYDKNKPVEPSLVDNPSLKHVRKDKKLPTPTQKLADALGFDNYFGGGT